MADSILRLKVESQEYDNKLKRAAEGIQRYADECRKAGGTLTQLDEGVEDFVKELGQMETVSKTAKGSLNEMSKVFTDLSVQYNKLTKEEKESPFGKALASSLDQLKGRIQGGKAELDNIGRSLNSTGGFLDSLKDKFTINIDALKLFNAGVTAAKAALNVAKDAFFASEANVDEWGRTMKSAQSLYEGFVTSLNTSNFSGFLSNINDIVMAAREAYNELDKLGTMRTIQSPQFSKQEAENTRMRTMLMTGRWISAGDGRQAPYGLKDGDLLSPGMLKRIEQQLQNGMNTITSLTKNELQQTGRAIDAYYNSLARQNGMSLSEFRQGTSSWAAFSQKMAGYDQYQQWRNENYYTDAWGNRRVKEGNPYQEYAKWGTFRVDKMGENSFNDLVNLIKQQQSQQSQMYSMMGQAYRTINRAEGITVKGLMNPGGSGGGGRGGSGGAAYPAYSMQAVEGMLSLSENPFEKYKNAAISIVYPLQQIEAELKRLQELQSKAFSPEVFAAYEERIKELQDQKNAFKGLYKDAETSATSFQDAAQAIGQVSQALGSLEDPGAKIAGIIGQAIANIALGFAQATAASSGGGIFGWIAAVVGGLATMVSTISAIHSATGYAQGGVIPGNSFSGDNQWVRVNAGETILTRAQAGNIAAALEGNGLGNLQLSAVVTAEQLKFLLNTNGKRTGYGEYVTSRNVRN